MRTERVDAYQAVVGPVFVRVSVYHDLTRPVEQTLAWGIYSDSNGNVSWTTKGLIKVREQIALGNLKLLVRGVPLDTNGRPNLT